LLEDGASALNEFLLLGNAATQFESEVRYEPIGMNTVNNADADALLRL